MDALLYPRARGSDRPDVGADDTVSVAGDAGAARVTATSEAGRTVDLSALAAEVLGAQAVGEVAAPPDYPDDLYDTAVRLAGEGESADAARLFLRLAMAQHRTAGAIYGLAAALCDAGRHDRALELALLLSDAPDAGPRAWMLAGYAAYRTGDAGLARRLLARGSRAARGRPDYAEELRFAQRLLLSQQFDG
ncbi:MAG: hypothetical protein ACU0BF_00660 [Paracoccaceae bacterium]